MSYQEIRILDRKQFTDTINSLPGVERVMVGLNDNPEIKNDKIVVNYSDEGYAIFEVVADMPHVLILRFMGTAC